MTAIPKLSLKAIGALPAKKSVAEGDEYVAAAIYGAVSKHEVMQTSTGEADRLSGNFEGINAKTGASFSSNRAFLPSEISEFLIDALNTSEGKAIEFAFVMEVKYNATSPVGYSYSFKAVSQLKEYDALAHLRSIVTKTLPKVKPETDTQPPKAKK